MNQRLLFVSHSHELVGGAEFSLLATVRAAVEKNFDCLVILPAEGSFSKRLDLLQIRYKIEKYTWSAISNYDKHAHLDIGAAHFNADSIITACETIEEFDPIIVVVNTIMPPWYIYAARALDTPSIMMVRESFDDRNSMRLLPVADEYLDNLSHDLNYVLYNSHYTRSMYNDHLGNVASAVFYPVIETTKKQLGKPIASISREVSIITPGSIVEHKNQLELLKALNELRRRGYDKISTTLMGHIDNESDYIRTIRSYIKNHRLTQVVHINNFSDTPFDVIKKHAIVVVPSQSEAFGRVTLEAQLLGRLTIGCNSGGTKELIDHKATGLLYEANDAIGLADQIEWAINHSDEAVSIAAAGQIKSEEKFLTKTAFQPFFEAISYVTKHHTPNKKRVAYYDPVYALIQRNLHVNSILDSYAHSLEEAAVKLSSYENQSLKQDLTKHLKKTTRKLKRS